ncbi:MAG: hypothetical protein WBA51_08705 [Erythrobacter sp.]
MGNPAGYHQAKSKTAERSVDIALGPDRKREIIDAGRQDWPVTIRKACSALHFDGSTNNYQSRRTDPAFLKKPIKKICQAHVHTADLDED